MYDRLGEMADLGGCRPLGLYTQPMLPGLLEWVNHIGASLWKNLLSIMYNILSSPFKKLDK